MTLRYTTYLLSQQHLQDSHVPPCSGVHQRRHLAFVRQFQIALLQGGGVGGNVWEEGLGGGFGRRVWEEGLGGGFEVTSLQVL